MVDNDQLRAQLSARDREIAELKSRLASAEKAPSHQAEPPRTLWRLSSSGVSGVIIGGLAGSAIVGPLGTIAGMVAGGVVGEALERQWSARPESRIHPER